MYGNDVALTGYRYYAPSWNRYLLSHAVISTMSVHEVELYRLMPR